MSDPDRSQVRYDQCPRYGRFVWWWLEELSPDEGLYHGLGWARGYQELICTVCMEAEEMFDDTDRPSPAKWPLPPEQLAREYTEVIRLHRRGSAGRSVERG